LRTCHTKSEGWEPSGERSEKRESIECTHTQLESVQLERRDRVRDQKATIERKRRTQNSVQKR
jgi:hypothetical protein